jgi:predicted enzyme related to lactoylglutathione lyase
MALLAATCHEQLFHRQLRKYSMTSPIKNRVGCIFIPVSDMSRAIDWYSRLLGLPVEKTTHGGLIYDVPMSGDVGLILDGHKPVTNSSQPLLFFWTSDIQSAYTFLLENGVQVERAMEDIGSVTTLTFKDPDNNLLMVCQRNQ